MRSNYVVAGFETLATILHNFTLNKRGRWTEQFTKDEISTFMKNTCAGFLHSFGQNFKNKKRFDKYKLAEARTFDLCREWGCFNESEFYIDSGGFQVSTGELTKHETDILLTLYYEYLVEHSDTYDKAFILDIPPGPGCKVYKDYEDVYKLNYQTYKAATNLPQHVKDKIVYIHHFRTPKLWDIFNKLLREEDFFGEFQHHGTGGIVANMSSDHLIPVVIYILPLIPLLNEAIRHNRKTLDFHVLGGANFRDLMFYEVIKKHVFEVHGIDVNITYDSSGLFKGLMIGRRLFVDDDPIIRKLDIRSHMIPLRIRDDMKGNDMIERSIDRFTTKYNFGPVPKPFEVYCDNSGTFHDDVKAYLMLQSLDLYATLQESLRNFVNEIYPLYTNGDIAEFNQKIAGMTQNLNSGKITSKQVNKSSSVSNSLNILTDLDEDYCKFIIDKFLSKDEFTNLTGQELLTF